MAKRDLYKEVTDIMYAKLEAGTPPWIRKAIWKDGKATVDMAHNGGSGHIYTGINEILVYLSGYVDPRWLTFNQLRNLGGNNKGQKATTIVIWKPWEKKGANGDVETHGMFCKAFAIWNMEQLTGIDETKLYAAPVSADLKATSGTDLAEQVGAKMLPYGGNRAYYMPSQDAIRLPTQTQFIGENCFDATMFHELVHWSGHKSRMDRNLSTRFGDDAYAAEELIAEMGSAFLCARLGIEMKGLQHDSYVDHWLRIMKSDNRAIFAAASQARQAVEYLLPSKVEEQEEALAA